MLTKHRRQVARRVSIDREAEGENSLLTSLNHGLAACGRHEARFGEFGDDIGEVFRRRGRIAIRRPLQPERILRMLVRSGGLYVARAVRRSIHRAEGERHMFHILNLRVAAAPRSMSSEPGSPSAYDRGGLPAQLRRPAQPGLERLSERRKLMKSRSGDQCLGAPMDQARAQPRGLLGELDIGCDGLEHLVDRTLKWRSRQCNRRADPRRARCACCMAMSRR